MPDTHANTERPDWDLGGDPQEEMQETFGVLVQRFGLYDAVQRLVAIGADAPTLAILCSHFGFRHEVNDVDD